MTSSKELQRLLRSSIADATAADELLDLYRPVLRLMAEQAVGAKMRRREDPSDVVQRTMLEAYTGFKQFQGSTEGEFSAWLKQIFRRNLANLLRDHWAAKRDVRREEHIDVGDGSVSVTWFQPEGQV